MSYSKQSAYGACLIYPESGLFETGFEASEQCQLAATVGMLDVCFPRIGAVLNIKRVLTGNDSDTMAVNHGIFCQSNGV